MKKITVTLAAAAFAFSCKNAGHSEKKQADATGQELVNQALDLANMDLEVRPQDDFYHFTNGNWMKTTEIPPDRGMWGSFYELRERTDMESLNLLEKSLQKTYEKGSEGQKIADFYQSIMDTVSRDKAGIQPIENQLATIDDIQDLPQLFAYLNQATPDYENPLFSFYVYGHLKKSNENAVYFVGADLGMSRSYYQNKDAESQEKLAAYQRYLQRLFEFIKDENPEKSAKAVVDLEKQMASYMLTFEELRDADKKYNPVQVSDLPKMVKNANLQTFLQNQKVSTSEVIVSELAYYKNFDKFYNSKNLHALKKYLKAHLVNGVADELSSDLEQLHFDFYGKELSGIEQMRALNKRALQMINNNLGEAFGKLYVEAYFPAQAKERAQEMVQYLLKSYKKHIEGLAWMTQETKVKALEKLAKFNVKIGYPDKWEDYSALEIKGTKDGGSLYQNMKNVARWQFNKQLEKVGKPVDKTKWGMPPQTVNAYYSPSFNEIVFPAAILQKPFFDFQADAALNFGGIGAVIGHEITHGFDDSGAKFDGDGNLNNWWSQQDKEAFDKLGKALVAQFDAYEPFPGIHVNGTATLGENIADLGGLSVAYDALQMYLQDKGQPELIDDFTQKQRFFISWATIWRNKSKDEALKTQIKTDFHAPARYRATAPLENLQGFYEAFDVKSEDKMYKNPEKRIVIW